MKYRTRLAMALGFSLLELLVVIAIIGALAAWAIPSYRQYNMRANRSQAAQVMLTIQNREEQYILDARAYTQDLGTTGLNIAQEGWTCTSAQCSNNFYTITVAVVAGTPPTYTITATAVPTSYQVGDGNLTLTNAGVRYRTAGDNRW